jgi:hypothetical protein
MVHFRLALRCVRLAVLTVLAVVALAPAAQAQTTVTLAWDPNSETDLAGYIVQYGTQSGNPSTNVDVGNVTSRQFTGLQIGVTYYFRVVAYNTAAMQSGPSTEVSYTPSTPPPAPTLSSVSPTSGTTAGGTVITLTGTNFVSGATVRVGGTSATGVTFLSATQLRATTPAGTAGLRAVQVTNPDTQSVTLNNAYTYAAPAPTLTSVSPTSGSTAGGTTITLNGTNFVSGATVRVGGTAATGVTFLSATQLRATTPAGTAGLRAVQVTNPDTQSVTLNNAYTYAAPAPTLTSVSPTSGTTAGGTTITLNGTNFVSGAAVRLDGVDLTGVTFLSATQLRAVTPAGTAGPADVRVTNPDAQAVTLTSGFTYVVPAPTIDSVWPASGTTAGGTTITLTGANFVSGATVRLGGVAATGVTFVSASELRATTPAGAAGAVSVQVTNPDAQSASRGNGFTYVAPTPTPTLTSVSPTSGPATGGTVITLSGANFVSGATVRVGGVAATGVTFVSASQVRATTPAGAAGAASVQLMNPDAQSSSLGSAFTYVAPAPSLTSIAPTSGPASGGTTVTLTGTNFLSGATVRFGGVAATGVTFVSATQLRATTPAGSRGVVSVQVTNPDAQSVTLSNSFTYTIAGPSVTSVSPASGPMAGGTLITITGTNFVQGGAALIRIGNTLAASYTFVNATTLQATTPAGPVGALPVLVVNADGQSAQLADGFTYTNSTTDDTDGDGMTDAYETQFGLDPNDPTGANGAAGDPDGDGVSNQNERTAGTHPRGFAQKYLAEGAVNHFFSTRLAIANPQSVEAKVLLTFVDDMRVTTRRFLVVPARSRRTVDARSVTELSSRSFSTGLDSDQPVVLDRLMTWDGDQYGAHAETAVDSPSTRWYLAEGATGGPFELFYLIQNPSATAATLQVRYLLPGGVAPVVKSYTVEAGSRFTIWVDSEDKRLADTDVSAEITSTNDVPVIVERSMYLNTPRRGFKGGHNSAGVTTTSTRWFLAEGATGEFFSMFVLFANPSGQDAQVRATYIRDSGAPIVREYNVPANGRYTVGVAGEDKALRSTSVAVQVESINAVPIIVERTMWWGTRGNGWTEGHNAFGTTTTGARWLLAEGEVGGTRAMQTYVLIANTSAVDANVKVTLLYENGPEESQVVTVGASRRYSLSSSDAFPNSNGRRFSVLIESQNPDAAGDLVVERAMYWNTSDEVWGVGSNAVATRLP